MKLSVDNQSAIKLLKTCQFNKRNKHIDFRYHFIIEKLKEGVINMNYWSTENDIADIFTKPLANTKFNNVKYCFMMCYCGDSYNRL